MKRVTRSTEVRSCDCVVDHRDEAPDYCGANAFLCIDADLNICRRHAEQIMRGLARELGYTLTKKEAGDATD